MVSIGVSDPDTAAVIFFGPADSFRVSLDHFHDGSTNPTYTSTYVGNTILTIVSPGFGITPVPVKGEPGVDVNLTASSTSYSARVLATSTYVWGFGDGTSIVSKLADSTVTHKWAVVGTYTLTAELHDSTGSVIGADTTQATIAAKASYVWVFQSATLTNVIPPVGGLVTRGDSTEYQVITEAMTELQQTPNSFGLQIFGQPAAGPACVPSVAAVVKFPGPQWTDSLVGLTHTFGAVGICGSPNFTGTLTLGPLGTGALVGSAVGNIPKSGQYIAAGGSINANMSAKTLAGSFVLLFRYSTAALASYTLSFTAQQVKP